MSRAMNDLAQSQPTRRNRQKLLAPAYGWFTEGFETADLKEAKKLLDELTRATGLENGFNFYSNGTTIDSEPDFFAKLAVEFGTF